MSSNENTPAPSHNEFGVPMSDDERYEYTLARIARTHIRSFFPLYFHFLSKDFSPFRLHMSSDSWGTLPSHSLPFFIPLYEYSPSFCAYSMRWLRCSTSGTRQCPFRSVTTWHVSRFPFSFVYLKLLGLWIPYSLVALDYWHRLSSDVLDSTAAALILVNERPQCHPDLSHRIAFNEALSYEIDVTQSTIRHLRTHLEALESLKIISDNLL